MQIPSFSDLLQNISTSIPPLMALVTAAMYLAGFILIFRALYHLKQFGELRTMMSVSAELRGPLILFLCGVALIFYPTMLDTSLQTVFGTTNVLAYDPGSASQEKKDTIKAAVMIVRFIGYIAFFRGWMLISRLAGQGSPPGTLSRALIHIIAGIFLINIIGTWDIIRDVLGFE